MVSRKRASRNSRNRKGRMSRFRLEESTSRARRRSLATSHWRNWVWSRSPLFQARNFSISTVASLSCGARTDFENIDTTECVPLLPVPTQYKCARRARYGPTNSRLQENNMSEQRFLGAVNDMAAQLEES